MPYVQIKASHSEEREYTNDKGEKCKDVIIHIPAIQVKKLVKELGEEKAKKIIKATQGKPLSPTA